MAENPSQSYTPLIVEHYLCFGSPSEILRCSNCYLVVDIYVSYLTCESCPIVHDDFAAYLEVSGDTVYLDDGGARIYIDDALE